MTNASYGYTKNLGKVDFDGVITRVEAALKTEGFGILTEIDVKGTLKKKIDVDFRKYKILGACNPKMAHHALTVEPLIGLLLPCNVIVMEEDDGTVTVSAAKPSELFKIVENAEMTGVAAEVDGMIQRVVDAI